MMNLSAVDDSNTELLFYWLINGVINLIAFALNFWENHAKQPLKCVVWGQGNRK